MNSALHVTTRRAVALANVSDADVDIARVIAIGASNLTRGFQTVVSTARTAWGPDIDIVAALGHGRSYGATSAFLVRRLPGILQSGLWTLLESTPVVPTRALVTDVGNDILYGFAGEQILEWVDEAVTRLARVSADVVLSGLPMDSIRRLSPAGFRIARSVLVPSSRLSHGDVVATAEHVHAGLERMARDRSLRFVALRSSWYGLDPIHIRPSLWQPAWQEILGVSCHVRRSRTEALRLYLMRPERQSLCGIEQRKRQTGTALPRRARLAVLTAQVTVARARFAGLKRVAQCKAWFVDPKPLAGRCQRLRAAAPPHSFKA
jgi:hypothetical protein